MVLAKSDQIPTIIQIPRQIPRHELIKLMPLEWISNYEQFHNNTAPIQNSESMFERRQDGTVRMTFKPPPSAPQEPPRLSFTYSSMITAVQTAQEDLPITGFNSEGYPIYPAKQNGHFLWDAPCSGMCDPTCPCWDDWDEDDDYATTRKKKPKKKKPPVFCHHYDPKPPQDPPPPPAPLSFYRKELKWIAKHCKSETPSPIPLPTPPLTCMIQYDPSKLFGMTHTLFRDNPLPPPPKPKPKPKPQPRPVILHPSSISIPGQHSPGHTPASPPVPPPPTESQPPSQSKDKQPMHQFSAHANLQYPLVILKKSYADITRILMAQPDQPTPGQTSHTEPYVDIPSEVEEEMHESSTTNQPPPTQAQTSPPSQKSSNGPWFTFDDLPSHKWRDRLNEMSAWIDLQMLRPGATTQSVLREFATRFTGALRDWFDSLGRYRQLQFVDLLEVSSALAVLHDQFLGDPSAVFEAARRDYVNKKCYSLNAKDLDFHYKRMSLLFYKLNGFNEPTLKHVFLASLPDELQPDIQRQLTASNLVLDNISLGKIFQLAKTCLDKLCEQKQFFKELLKDKEPFRSACKKPYLQIKCKKKKDCDCSPKKKRHFKKFRNLEIQNFHPDLVDPESLTDSFERSHLLPETLNGENQADVSFAKRKAIMPKTVPTSEKNLFDSDQSQVTFHQQLLSRDTTVPIPSIKLQILPSKFQRPIPAIGLIDTGAQCSMLNLHILPPEYWTEYEEHFKAVNDKLFTTSLITKKPIGSHDEHRQLLTQFYDIVQSHGIMLSVKKSTIATDNIEFLDASDDSWGAILLEEINGKEHFIAYASGQFSDTQKHYHSVFEEILAVKNDIKKFEYHLIGHHFLIRMDSSAFLNILNFKEKPLILFSTTYHFPIISMATSLPPEALTKKTFPFNKNFSSVFAIQEFAKKALFRFFMKAYLVTEPFPFSSFHLENLFLTGLTLDPSRETTQDVLWYIWCLTVLYATKLVLPITPTLEHLLNPDKATSLTWTLLEWFSPISWWRKKLQHLSEIYNLERMPAPEAQLFTSIFIIHRPYFQHPDTNLFWTQDQVYEWFTALHPAVIDNEIQDVLHNYRCQLNHQPPPLKDIFHTSLGPQHDLRMIPTPSAISNPKSTDFLPLSQHLQQFPQPSMNEPGSSSQPPKADTATKPSKVDKATQTSPRPGNRRDCPYPPCRGPHCKHPKLSKTFFPKSNCDNPYETESSSEDDYMNLRPP
ncbi:hypothetical protein KPL71_001182 [Citrus sinensis]|uniref:Uncharacterized protein n=1 Tax=Citrus sinensis TaxID=2711 RepID=A0ACB8NWX5_CITSI|nr:hypothetical protein KPL71_001182 [Citrus sinensis]